MTISNTEPDQWPDIQSNISIGSGANNGPDWFCYLQNKSTIPSFYDCGNLLRYVSDICAERGVQKQVKRRVHNVSYLSCWRQKYIIDKTSMSKNYETSACK